MKNIDLLTNKYLALYKKEKLAVKKDQLKQSLIEITNQAKKNYQKLEGGKTCSLSLYIYIWIRKVVMKDLAIAKINDINLEKESPLLKASAKYFSLLSYKKHKEIYDQLFAVKVEARQKVWKSFNLPIKDLENSFKKMTLTRIQFAKEKGFNSYVEMFLDKYQIPKNDYEQFAKNIDRVINYCNQRLPKGDNLPVWFYSKFNLPCFMCQQVEFPFKGLGEAIKEIVENNQLLDDFKRKINIEIGESSKVNYQEKTDTFKIIINKRLNLRHQIAELIHELAHIIVYLENFKKEVNPLEKGNYWREKRTIQKELKILEQVGEPLRANLFNEGLLVFWQIMFQIKICNNKKQNLSKIYAQVFNQCFKDGRQKNNPTFILQGNITLNSFFQLPHAVAQANFIEKI